MKQLLLVYPFLLLISVNAFAAEVEVHTGAVQAAYKSVIRECNDVASQTDVRFMSAMSNKPYTEKEKTQLLATTHNAFLQLCLLGVAAELKKYADGLDALTGK